eukprot:SAG22_NODE_10573_length_527_cov_0.843458_2_plen_41_part_01
MAGKAELLRRVAENLGRLGKSGAGTSTEDGVEGPNTVRRQI